MTSLRYQPVDPERLDIEPDIYQSGNDTENIFGESANRMTIGLREIMAIPHLKSRDKAVCMGSLAVIASLMGVILILILGGWMHVKADLRDHVDTVRNGLQLVPTLYNEGQQVIVLSNTKEGTDKYVKELDKYLQDYFKEQVSREKFIQKCEDGKKPENSWCRFPASSFQRPGTKGCTAEERFGFDSKEPCFLLSFRDKIGWEPTFSAFANTSQLPVQCSTSTGFEKSSTPVNITYLPVHRLNANYGAFPLNKIPSRKLIINGNEVSDDDGETLYDLPGLLFVKFSLPDRFTHGMFYCKIVDTLPGAQFSNLNELKGIRDIRFQMFTE